MKRRCSELVLRVDIRAMIQKHRGDRSVAVRSRIMQWCSAPIILGAQISAPGEQQGGSFDVTTIGSAMEWITVPKI